MPAPSIDSLPEDLGVYGFDHQAYRHTADRDFTRWDDAFFWSEDFLSACRYTIPAPLSAGADSYGTKHAIEALHAVRGSQSDGYVPNGVFIAAAISLGIPWCRQADSPNATIGVNGRRLARAADRWRCISRGQPRMKGTRYDATDRALDATLYVKVPVGW